MQGYKNPFTDPAAACTPEVCTPRNNIARHDGPVGTAVARQIGSWCPGALLCRLACHLDTERGRTDANSSMVDVLSGDAALACVREEDTAHSRDACHVFITEPQAQRIARHGSITPHKGRRSNFAANERDNSEQRHGNEC